MTLDELLEPPKLPGGRIDHVENNRRWEAYRRQQVASGDRCRVCGGATPMSAWGKGVPARCAECAGLDDPGKVEHSGRIRCPSCGEDESVDDLDLYEQGPQTVSCGSCDHEYEVEVEVSFSYTSPARLPEGGAA